MGDIQHASNDYAELTFTRADGSRCPLEFSPGQSITVSFPNENARPRQYFVTSAPGRDYLKCCIKLDVLHGMRTLKLNSKVGLTAPSGVRSIGARPVVLVSLGGGIAPMKS